MRDAPQSIKVPPRPISYDDTLGRQIIELHIWAVGQGLRGTAAAGLFEGLCERLVMAGVPLWRLRRHADIASPMGRLRLYLVA
jgi:adenylate cyclase